MQTPGQRLRAFREMLGLTLRDVESASARIAERHGKEDFTISLSRLSDIETKGVAPNIYRLHSLGVIYRKSLLELLEWYGIDANDVTPDLPMVSPPNSHLLDAVTPQTVARIPLGLDPGFDLKRSMNLGRVIEQWGVVPLAFLAQFSNTDYTYGYIGSEDFTMYPLLLPGSFVQVDESLAEVRQEVWRTEYERPIYFVETRQGYSCCWCSVRGGNIVLQSHPLSPVPVRVMEHPKEAEVIGQVIGIAMRLDQWGPSGFSPIAKGRQELN